MSRAEEPLQSKKHHTNRRIYGSLWEMVGFSGRWKFANIFAERRKKLEKEENWANRENLLVIDRCKLLEPTLGRNREQDTRRCIDASRSIFTLEKLSSRNVAHSTPAGVNRCRLKARCQVRYRVVVFDTLSMSTETFAEIVNNHASLHSKAAVWSFNAF